MSSIFALTALAMVGGTDTAQASASQKPVTDKVTVTQVSANPDVVSGIFAMAVKVSGRTEGGDRTYYITFLAEDQPKPRVGEVCDITWRWMSGVQYHLANWESVSSGRFVTTFQCELHHSS